MMEQYEVYRAEIARVMYDEARRLRELQDGRINDIRQRSITVLTLVSAAVVVVSGVSDTARTNSVAMQFALLAVVAMILSGVAVHVPIGGYSEGPSISDLHDHQYKDADPGYQVLRDVSLYHHQHYQDNNRGVLKWINLGFAAELIFAAAAVVAVISSALT